MHILLQLLKRDLLSFKKEFFSRLSDTAFLIVTNLIVFGYFMSHSGLGRDYGAFMLVTAIASYGFFNLVGHISTFIQDIEGDRTISYTLTLPVPYYIVFIHQALCWALRAAFITIFIFPLGKLILWDRFDMSQISYLKLIPMFFTVNFFYGIFGLWLSSLLKQAGQLSLLWIRVINPLVMFGGFFYTWQQVHEAFPKIAPFLLINPILYALEGLRSTILGSQGYLPSSLCFAVLWIFTIIFGLHAIRRLKKRLDCVS
jgi:ABC-type polysaccharide/polyol phosphate export permease